jgi:hypothetical protein
LGELRRSEIFLKRIFPSSSEKLHRLPVVSVDQPARVPPLVCNGSAVERPYAIRRFQAINHAGLTLPN